MKKSPPFHLLLRAFASGALAIGLTFTPATLEPARAQGSAECGPPSEDIPGPPAWLIRVGQPMPESWLHCYIWRDVESQDYRPTSFGEVRHTSFAGYPVECVNPELAEPSPGGSTEGLVAELYAYNAGGEQYVRFTYRIQLDGDYINNCAQELLPLP